MKTKAKCEYDGEEQDEGMEGGWVHTQPDLRYYKLRSGSVQYKKKFVVSKYLWLKGLIGYRRDFLLAHPKVFVVL